MPVSRFMGSYTVCGTRKEDIFMESYTEWIRSDRFYHTHTPNAVDAQMLLDKIASGSGLFTLAFS
jgi:hypothetical protein